MAQINKHVSRMSRYLPFSSSHDQIYEEYQNSADSMSLDTRAFDYLVSAVQCDNAKVIVLTGDAGHGKTHLCRRLIEEYLEYNENDARKLLVTRCDGNHAIAHQSRTDQKPLRIYKDFSEISVFEAAGGLEQHLVSGEEIVVVCANEGRLRAVLDSEQAGNECLQVKETFLDSFSSGLASRDGAIHIVNLNYQSVVSDSGNGLMDGAFKDWLNGRRWTACTKCEIRDECIINHNRIMLSEGSEGAGQVRLKKIGSLVSAVERLRNVVTIREMLMLIAYMITGGLTCSEVSRLVTRRSEKGWQHQYAYYNLLFQKPDTVSADQTAGIPVLSQIALLDPGLRALRNTDERLINQQGIFKENQLDLIFKLPAFGKSKEQLIDAADGIDEIIYNPRNKKEREKEASFTTEVVRALRRKAFFDEEENKEFGSVMKRLGFDHGDDFQFILEKRLKGKELSKLKRLLIAGLHTIQGLQLSKKQNNLHFVDPAFGSASSHAAIMAGKIPSAQVKLIPMSEAWSIKEEKEQWSIRESVDWIDRHIVMRIEGEEDFSSDIFVDLMLFDCLTRAGFGYVAEKFYAHDLRKIDRFLESFAENLNARDQDLQLFLYDKMYSVGIDDGVISVGSN